MPKKKSRAPVTVVTAPSSSFPDFSSFSSTGGGGGSKRNNNNKRGRQTEENNHQRKKIGIEIDFDETVKEIHTLGSTQFTGKQKRQYEAEQYKAFTGLEKKKHKVPLKIVRGIKKKAIEREKRIEQENRDAGIVTANTNRKKVSKSYSEQNRRDSRIHGPAPTIGFTKKGVLSVRKEKR